MAVLSIFAFQVILFLGVYHFVQWIRSKKDDSRNVLLSGIAAHLGLRKVEFGAEGIMHQLKPFKLFERERRVIFKSGRITDVYSKMVGDTTVYLFEYAFSKKQGKHSKTVRHIVFFADDKTWYLPNFKLEPETWWQKVMARFGKGDINFPNNEEFSDSYWLTSEFEEQTRTLFRPELKAFLNARPPIKMEGSNYYLCASVEDQLNAEGISAFYEDCSDVVKLLKSRESSEVYDLSELIPTAELVEEMSKKLRE